jgi:hypothetical protein
MTLKVANYTFSSWLRKGIGNQIVDPDNLGAGGTAFIQRTDVSVTVQLNGAPVFKNFALIGPGDIIGINPQMVVRTEPLKGADNVEPNYLAFIEFYDEELPWRYTPAQANGALLRPWIALLVLKEGTTPATSEFTKNDTRLPLPTVTVKSAAALPPHTQTWAWGHVHTNDGYESHAAFEKFLLSLHDPNNSNADKIISRLLSPRKLEPEQSYRAFVVPAFETGRLAGLGMDVTKTPAQQPAWNAGSANLEFPIYYEWSFRTGENSDFESLVKLLDPNPVPAAVGRRNMDGSQPGFGLSVGTDLGDVNAAEDPNPMIIGLEGALKSPSTKPRPTIEKFDTSRPFFHKLEDILNFPAKWQASSNVEQDPVVCPPLYGENHARTHEIDVTGFGWLTELNRDPRNRVPAGFGTNVIKKFQEDFVAYAWTQVKKVFDANLRIRFGVYAMSVASAIQTSFVARLDTPKMMLVFAPVLKKVKGSATTLFHQLETSNIPPAAIDSALRRMIRPRGPYGLKLKQADPNFSHTKLIEDLNEGKVSAAPPKKVPDKLVTDEGLAADLPCMKHPKWVKWLLKHRLLVLILVLLVLLIVALLTGAWIICLILAVLAIIAYFLVGSCLHQLEFAAALKDPATMLEAIKNTPPQPGFTFVVTDPVVPIESSGGTTVTTTDSSSTDGSQFKVVTMFTRSAGGGDSLEAGNFRQAATQLFAGLSVRAPARQTTRFDLANAREKLERATDPAFAFTRLIAGQVDFTFDRNWLLEPEHLVPAMAYPDFPNPMYEKLRDIDTELFLPNLKLVPPNTISLLETNPPFIESYMTGLNHEFGRELLWREYPTDQRGSYFRQFWNVKGISDMTDPEVYKDIIPLDQWGSKTALGEHRNPARGPGEQLVLLVRGDLLKKYPNTIIYAQKAHAAVDSNGAFIPGTEPVVNRSITTEADMKAEIRFPIFRAEIDPDYRFFGFDLTAEIARGDLDPKPGGNFGWFFILQEIPGEPRFGMDIKFEPDQDTSTPITWDDLGWDKYNPTTFIDTSIKPVADYLNQLTEPERNQWGTHSAAMAFILYQKPVMVAIHANEMLADL